MSNPEEINLSGPDTVKLDSTGHDANAVEHEQRANISVADLSNIVPAGASNEEFLDALVLAPKEKLIVWEQAYLPSRGLYYGWPDGMCYVRGMGQKAEKVLATQRLTASGQAIDYLFRECCKFPDGFDPAQLLLGDRTFLLYYLRGITYGNQYDFAVTCANPECGETTTHVYDLNNLVESLKMADPGLGDEPFKVSLPYLSQATKRDVWVGVRFLRAFDANDMLARRRTTAKLTGNKSGVRNKSREVQEQRRQLNSREDVALDNTLDENLEKMIVNVMGVADQFKIRSFVKQLHSLDTGAIRDWLKEHTPGIDSSIEITCPACQQTFNLELPITESFFRPSKARGTG